MNGVASRGLQEWLQERQYATPYHWRQTGNDAIEYQLRTDVVLELVHLPRRSPRSAVSLLDIGCGDGRFASDATAAARTIGIDISKRALGFAQRLVPDAAFVASAAWALPFRSDSFDAVTLLDVIEHIRDDDEPRVVAEAVRVLKPGGRLAISTNTDRAAREWKHYRHYSVARFRALFDGLGEITIAGLIPYFPTLRFWMQVPIAASLFRSRIRLCPPEAAHVVIGAGTKR